MISTAGRLTLAWTIAVLAAVGPAPGSLAADRPFDPEPFSTAVHGDFLYVGNGVLRCPEKGEDGTDAQDAERCQQAAQRQGAGTNAGHFMQQSDVDGRDDTFNSSTSQLTVPAGARVTFAQLNWGGHTGRHHGDDDLHCMAGKPKAKHPPPPAKPLDEDGPRRQNPELRIGDANIHVDAAGGPWRGKYTEDELDDSDDGQFYTNYQRFAAGDPDPQIQAELAKLAQLPTGTALPVTVGNIWSVYGVGCAAGWSLVLIYEFDQAGPAPESARRQILLYNGHVTPDSDPTTLSIAGFLAEAPDTRIGLTAYDGDWGPGGQDRFAVDGTLQPEPETGDTNDFFLSDATMNDSHGAGMDPAYRNNFSVDAKVLSTASIKVDDQTADLSFLADSPGYLVQNVAVSLPLAELTLTKTAPSGPVRPGDTANFTVTVTNPTQAEAHDVLLEDPAAPSCASVGIAVLAPGESRTFTCGVAVPADAGSELANSATVSWAAFGGRSQAVASATATVVRPGLSVTKSATPATVVEGDSVGYTIVVRNAGDSTVTGIGLTDVLAPGCAQHVGELASGHAKTVTCAAVAGATTFTNSATATGTGADAKPVTATGQATVTVIPAKPALTVTQTAAPATQVRPGDSVKLTVKVMNSGNVPLTGVQLANSEKRVDCGDSDLSIGALAAGASAADIVCTITAATADKTVRNTATATGTALGNRTVTGRDTDRVTVVHPALTVAQTASPATVVRPGDPVKLTVRVTNSGDVPLTGVQLANSEKRVDCGDSDLSIGALAAGASAADIVCTITAATADKALTNTATATGAMTAPGVATSAAEVTGSDTDGVTVIHPALAVTKTATPSTVQRGGTVAYRIVVGNTGDTTITGIKLSDELAAGCNSTVGTLQKAQVRTVQCRATAAATTFTNSATATGTGSDGKPVAATGKATVTVVGASPALTIRKTADERSVTAGTPVTFTVTVTNTGGVPLTVEVVDKTAPQCGMSIAGAGLAPGAAQSQSCTVTPSAIGHLSNTATFTARPVASSPATPLTGTSTTVTVQVDPAPAAPPPTPPADHHPSGHHGLGSTGGPDAGLAAAGAGLLLSGLSLVVAARRRRPRS